MLMLVSHIELEYFIYTFVFIQIYDLFNAGPYCINYFLVLKEKKGFWKHCQNDDGFVKFD